MAAHKVHSSFVTIQVTYFRDTTTLDTYASPMPTRIFSPWGKLEAMRNRKNTNIVLLGIILVAIIALWIFRTQFLARKAAGPAEFSEARVGPPDIYPDPVRTPGSTNPDITQ